MTWLAAVAVVVSVGGLVRAAGVSPLTNPVIAVVLGAIVLHERFVAVEYVGMSGILLAVFLVTSSKMKSGKPNVVDEDLALRQQA